MMMNSSLLSNLVKLLKMVKSLNVNYSNVCFLGKILGEVKTVLNVMDLLPVKFQLNMIDVNLVQKENHVKISIMKLLFTSKKMIKIMMILLT
jgi:hypothetical protein